MYLVVEEYRGNGYGISLWKTALSHLADLPCIGLEAAPDRVEDYSKWGFSVSSLTTRWQIHSEDGIYEHLNLLSKQIPGLSLLHGKDIPANIINDYDQKREPSPRPHFIRDWLNHPAGDVLALIDKAGRCQGFGRIRPCLLNPGIGWRVGPIIADTPDLAQFLIVQLISRHPGLILIDSPGLNSYSDQIYDTLGFSKISQTTRMYKGTQPPISMNQVYGLACLELG